jgi:hypothetical protein
MKKKRANPNKGIMFGIMAMAVVVLAVVVFFWMWCFPDGTHGTEETQTEYRISLDEGFRGDSVQLQINDNVACGHAKTPFDWQYMPMPLVCR